MPRGASAIVVFSALSAALHLVLALLVPVVTAVAAPAELVELELRIEPGSVAGGDEREGARAPIGDAVALPGGADSIQNVDARDRGVGGERTGASTFVMLLPRADAITLTDAPMNALGASQTQRIDTGRERATPEDRRATPHPEDDAFLASGDGTHAERRALSDVDPQEGARTAPVASARGAISTPLSQALAGTDGSDPRSRSREATAGTAEASPGRGILGAEGTRESSRADVAFGRPTLDEGAAATTSERRDARTRDDEDAELLAARMSQSMVESTRRRGREVGDGSGGTGETGAAGSGGGSREGGHASALGTGSGAYDALDTSDERYRRWLLELRSRIDRALVFPRARMLAMDQGTSVYRVVVRRDGRLVGRPRLVRSSGFDDLDGAALAAIERAMPFAPVPDDLQPEQSQLRIVLPIEFANPMVR